MLFRSDNSGKGAAEASGSDSAPAKTKARFRIRQAQRYDRDLLAQLGVRPSATFLANATIWVEGISDVAYLRAYMEAFVHYLKYWGGAEWKQTAAWLSSYKEDNHYAFVEYNGANLEHFDFSEDSDDPSPDAADAAADAGSNQAKAAQDTSTRPAKLCAQALVIADGDIASESKRKRLERFKVTLKNDLIVLPGKEVENLIPEYFVREQVRFDHKIKGNAPVAEEILEAISYNAYCRLRSESNPQELLGIGKYLCDRGINKYGPSKTGTLPDRYKNRWRTNSEGIPGKIRGALRAQSQQNNAAPEDQLDGEQTLPDFLTQDLIWLCTCIYAHIAQCNHHTAASAKLESLRVWMRQRYASSAETGQGPHETYEMWPIRNPESRACVLTLYSNETVAPENPSTD